MTEDERIYHKKKIDLKAVSFPEVNPVDFTVKAQGKQLKLATYRFPSAQAERKGVIHYVNGYGDYCARYAFVAQ